MPPEGAPQERTVIIEDESLRQFTGGFTSVPNRILRNNQISLGSRMCYGMLLSYAWQDDFCFPAQTRLADDLGIGERTVRQYLNELRDAGLITWKQRGLNRPNVYRILKLPAVVATNGNGHPGPAKSAAPDRHSASGQDRHVASAYKDSTKNTHRVVNVTANDHTASAKGNRPSATTVPPSISDRALRAKYNLTDEQIGRVHWLVEKQTDVLGATARNHAHYVKRAAEAVRDGDGDFLDQMLGDLKQAATEIAIGSRPAYFNAMFVDGMKKRHAEIAVRPPTTTTQRTPTGTLERLGETFSDLFRGSKDNEPDETRNRMITGAEDRGFAVPEYIRTANLRAVNRWWAALPDTPTKQT